MTISVSTPGGANVEFPDGTDAATIHGVMSQAHGAPDSQSAAGIDYSRPDDAVRQSIAELPTDQKPAALATWAKAKIASGKATSAPISPVLRGIPFLGPWAEKTSAALTAGNYDENLALVRAQDQGFDARNPVTSTVGQLAGTAAVPIPPAETLLGNSARFGALGAAEGGNAGYARTGTAEGALTGAKIGALTGSVLPVGGAVASRAVGGTVNALAPGFARMFGGGPDAAANTIIAQRLAQSGSSPANAAADLAAGQQAARFGSNSNAQLPEMLADHNDTMQRLTGSAYRAGGQGAEDIRGALNTRQRGAGTGYGPSPTGNVPNGQLETVQDAVDRAMEIKSSGTARATEADLIAAQKAKADTLYGQARTQSEPFNLQPAIDALQMTKKQYPRAFAGKLQEASDLFAPSETGVPNANRFAVDNITRFDNAKKALDDMISKADRAGENNLVRELTGFKDNLLEHVHAPGANGGPIKNPIYQQARDEFGTDAENQKALQFGRDALKENSEVSVEQFNSLNKAQQKLARIGMREGISNTFGSKRPGQDVTQLFQQRRVRDLLNAAIPRSKGSGTFADRPQRFGEYMARQGNMVGTRTKVLGNSETAGRLADDQQFNGDVLGNLYNRFRQSPSVANLMAESVAALGRRFFGMRADVAQSLARRLMDTNPNTRQQYLMALGLRHGPQRVQAFMHAIDQASGTLGAGTGQAIGEQVGAQ